MSGTLMAHRNTRKVTRETLLALPPPEALGPRHRPVPHHELVTTLERAADANGYRVVREEFAINGSNTDIFGVFDIARTNGDNSAERGLALGFRGSNARKLALKAVAGSHVFVCDNLCLHGEFVAMFRKHTTGLDLEAETRGAFERFLEQSRQLDNGIEELQARRVSDTEAKEIIYEVFSTRVLPLRLLPEVDQTYFRPDESWTDCTPRTHWGVYSACTRSARRLELASRMRATTRLAQLFDLGRAQKRT